MKNIIQKGPTILAALVLFITVPRVSAFAENRMHADWLGVFFAILLTSGVFLGSYYDRVHMLDKSGGEDRRSKDVRRNALAVLVFFILADGMFNLAEVFETVRPDTVLMQIATAVYGVFPTIAAALLGSLQAKVDRLPAPPVRASVNIGLAVRKLVVAKLNAQAPELPAGNLPESGRKLSAEPETQPATWRELSATDRKQISSLTSAQIVSEYGVTERTARNWRSRVATNGNGHNAR